MRSSEVVEKREALQELIRSDGWKMLREHLITTWHGDGYMQRMRSALASPDKLRPHVVDAVSIEMTKLLQWPVNQLRELKGDTE